MNAQHATITIKGGKYTLQKVGESKILRNGRKLNDPAELVHLDRWYNLKIKINFKTVKLILNY